MLSLQINPINNPSETTKYYFSKDNYYFSSELGTQWHGLAADKLGLRGDVKQNELEAVLGGLLPNGSIIGLQSQTGEIKHRGGYDLTFSAPKSLSYLALVSGHNEFKTLHLTAVKKVLSYIEAEAAEARKSGKNGIEYEKTGNLCFATILHDTSRDQDPHLHVHALLMNLTERLDGQWRALASDISRNHGTMEWIMNNQILLGLIYRSEIALGLKELGLDIEFTGDSHGLFEIKHFNKELLSSLSKRRNDIEDKITTMQSDTVKAYERATQDTRKAKKATDPETLRERWKEESNAQGVNPATYWSELKEQTKQQALPSKNDHGEPVYGVLEAIAHMEERTLHFSYQDLLQASLYFSLGKESIHELVQSIDNQIASSRLIALDNERTQFTTQGLIAKEKEIIEKLHGYSSQQKGLVRNTEKVCALTQNETIQKAVLDSLFDKEGLVRIKQDSATSRELLNTLIDYVGDFKKISVLTPTKAAALSVNEHYKSSPQSLWQWLLSIGKPDLAQTVSGFNYHHKDDHNLPFFTFKKESELIIVDDSQRLSPGELNKLLTITQKRSAKVIFLEKKTALTGFQSDIPELLDKAQVKTIEVSNKVKSVAAVHIVEKKEKFQRLQSTAKHYASLSPAQRKMTQVLTNSKKEAIELNVAIREELKQKGEITRDEKELFTLSAISMTASEKKIAKSYKAGMVLLRKSEHGLKELTITGINEKTNRLVVTEANGEKRSLLAKDIGQTTQVYERIALNLSVGDKLQATSSRGIPKLNAASLYEVKSLDSKGITLTDGKKNIRLPCGVHDTVPLTYAYCKSVYAHDFKPANQTLLTLPAYALRKNTMEHILETTREDVTVITDDVLKATRFSEKLNSKTTAIDLTLHAANHDHGIKVINDHTTQELLDSLNKAIDALIDDKPIKSEVEKALEFAITHLSEKEAVFSRSTLLTTAIKKAIGEFNIDDLIRTVNQALDDGGLIQGKDNLLTTKEALYFETSIINTVKAGRNTVKPILSIDEAQLKLKDSGLTKGQQEACQLITTTSDQFVIIQGYAGTGKTTMTKTAIDAMSQVKSMSQSAIDIIAVAPTHQAVKEMRALEISAQTLKSFIIEQKQEATLSNNAIVILDESSMVSNRDFFELTQLIQDAGARGIFLGDIGQHQSIESGKPSKLLMQEGCIQVACMDDLVRQQVKEYKQAVETLIEGDAKQALQQFKLIKPTLIERNSPNSPYNSMTHSIIDTSTLKDNEKITQSTDSKEHAKESNSLNKKLDEIEKPIIMAVEDYLSRTPTCRDKTIVIIHANKQRSIANEMIRNALMEEGSLGQENQQFTRLVGTNYSTAELYHIETYRDCLKEGKTHYLKINSEYYEITNIDLQAKVVYLTDSKGKQLLFIPEKQQKKHAIELFEKEKGNLSIGDKIHFKKSDKSRNRFANERAQVISLAKDHFTVRDNTGCEHTLLRDNLSDSHWDHSYTSTSYSIQGASSPFVIGVATTGNEKLNHFRSFYIMATRGSMHAMIYTDNYTKLKKQLDLVPDKSSALEAMGRISTNIKSQLKPQEKSSKRSTESKRNNVKSARDNSVNRPNKSQQTTITEPRYDATAIVNHLKDNAELVIETLLGAPNPSMSSKTEFRYGRKGSLTFCLTGEKRGTWYDFEALEGGNLLHLIQKTCGLNFKESLQYAAKITGDDLKETIKTNRIESSKTPGKTSQSNKNTLDFAMRLAKESKPINGTLGERYLKEVRGVQNINSPNIRFHPAVYTKKDEIVTYRPALLNIAKVSDDKVVAVEAIFLNKETAEKADDAPSEKRSYGNKRGAGVIINEGNKEAVTYVAEGVETALSVRDVVKNERVIATLGKNNMLNIDINLLTNKVVLCLDNDKKDVLQDKAIIDIIERLKNHGKTVEVAIPSDVKDFNDLAREKGLDSVLNTLKNAAPFDAMDTSKNKINISNSAIEKSILSLSKEVNLSINHLEKPQITHEKQLKKIEMEIY